MRLASTLGCWLLPLASALRVSHAGAPTTYAPQLTAARSLPPRCVAAVQSAAPTKPDAVSSEQPLHVLIAGAGVGGLALANCLELSDAHVTYTVLERTKEFKKFGGPIQLASNAMESFKFVDSELYKEIESFATWTGNRTNGIKDGVRDEWYSKFDLKTPAFDRNMPYTCVVDRPDLQDVLMKRVGGNIRQGAGVMSYKEHAGGVTAMLEGGEEVHGDVLIGADGIWSNVRATMTDTPARGPESGVTYSGYTVFAGELDYGGGDPECGYKVYIGPQQYFVITDVGNGRYQWYAFLARVEGSEQTEEKPEGVSPYLQGLFEGWSPEIHDILIATQENEIEQRDLYDRPPSVFKPWTKGKVALLGDAIHAMMPNLGQGGCQALEDALVLTEQMEGVTHRSELADALSGYRNRRLTRSAAVQGLSRFASDIIIRGFDTPCKLGVYDGKLVAENLNYAGIVTRMLQPILPIFFAIQFAFLYDGWQNKFSLEQVKIGISILFFGGLLLLAFAATAGTEVAALGFGLEALIGAETAEVVGLWFTEQSAAIQEVINSIGGSGL